MKAIFRFLFFAFLIIIGNYFFALSVSASEKTEAESKTIRVGYPIQEGLAMVDDEGNYYGYTYDYLMEVSKYTGWNYEIVLFEGDNNNQILTAMDMLEKGEIDLLGSMNYVEALTDIYAYPGYCYGTNYAGIYVPTDSSLSESTLYTSGKIKVGVFRKSLEKNPKLEQFALMNNIDLEQIVVDSQDELDRMLQEKEVDAILSTEVAMYEHYGMHAIARFSPVPFYFATKKGNVDIVRQLDYAISTIEQVNSNFAVELYNKYFSKYSAEFRLTEDEVTFIKTGGIQEVVLYDNKPPFSYKDDKTGEPAGITVEILNMITKLTGLKFRLNMVSTYEDYKKMIQSGKVDIAADILLNNQDAIDYNSMLTLPWHSLSINMLYTSDTDWNGICAIPYFLKNVVEPPEQVVYYDTVKQCLKAVQNGTAQYTYLGEYCSQYFLNSGAYNDLKLQVQPDNLTQQLSFGMVDTKDFYLLSIFNKCISKFKVDEVEEIIYKNTYQHQEISAFIWIKNNKGTLSIAVMTLVILSLAIYILLKNREQQRIAFENKRYDTLSDLSNEFFYEYDILKDTLVLPKNSAQYFSCDGEIQHFSKKVDAIEPKERIGIWLLGDYIIRNGEGSQELSCQMPDDSRQWFKLVNSPVFSKKKQMHTIGKIVNIQDMKAEQIRLEQKAFTDGLTGIYNVTTLKGMVRERLACFEDCSPCALIILDVDNFKQINDRFGHYNGDAVLMQVAKLISEIFCPNLVGRLGGDEFVIFVENTSETELNDLCGKMCREAKDIIKNMLGTSGTLSVGITFITEKKSYETLYKEADHALYQRKSNAKNGYTFFQQDMAIEEGKNR